jgi:hypothetical protein
MLIGILEMEKENNSVEQIDTDDDSSKDQYLKSDRYNNIFYHKDNDIVLEYMRDGVFEDPALVNINTQALNNLKVLMRGRYRFP